MINDKYRENENNGTVIFQNNIDKDKTFQFSCIKCDINYDELYIWALVMLDDYDSVVDLIGQNYSFNVNVIILFCGIDRWSDCWKLSVNCRCSAYVN